MPEPKKGAAYTFDIGLMSTSGSSFLENPTIATGDFKISQANSTGDLSGFVNLANNPVADGEYNVKVYLTSSEMNYDRIVVKWADASGNEWLPGRASIQTTTSVLDDIEAGSISRLNKGLKGVVEGVVGSGSTTTSIVPSSLSPSVTDEDQFVGKVLTFARDTTTAGLRGQATSVEAVSAGGTLTVTALTRAPASGDTFTLG